MPDLGMPEFPREMVTSLGLLLTMAIQSAARETTKAIIASFWDTRFKNNLYKLIPRAIFATEDVMATHIVIAKAPYHVQGRNQLLIHILGTHLFLVAAC